MMGSAVGEDLSPRNLTLMVCVSRLTQHDHDVEWRRHNRVSVIALSLFPVSCHETSSGVNGRKCRSEEGGDENDAEAKKHDFRRE